jgi:hypothetical protein
MGLTKPCIMMYHCLYQMEGCYQYGLSAVASGSSAGLRDHNFRAYLLSCTVTTTNNIFVKVALYCNSAALQGLRFQGNRLDVVLWWVGDLERWHGV